MRVLWVCNQCIGKIAEQLNIPGSNKEGWLAGLYDAFTEKDTEVTLGICFPSSENKKYSVDHLPVYSFAEDTAHPEIYEENAESRFAEIFSDFRPDIVHIFGTEYAHTLAAAKALHDPGKLLIGFQGVCNALYEEYLTGVEKEWISKNTLRDTLKSDNMENQKKKFALRAEHEREAVKLAGYVTGRTRLDHKYAMEMNPDVEYLFLNETMREIFYEGEWKQENAVKHSIFVSQCDYPIKGFHIFAKAMEFLKEDYPDFTVRVAGNTITGVGGLKKKILIPTYGEYLNRLMKEAGVKEQVTFLGSLSAAGMKKEYLSCNVFVLPSVMENSPNSLGEAMLLGVPSVASDVGGVADIMNSESGILYENNDPALLAKAIGKVFQDLDSDGGLVKGLVENAKVSARKKHNKEENKNRLLEMYRLIYKEQGNDNP